MSKKKNDKKLYFQLGSLIIQGERIDVLILALVIVILTFILLVFCIFKLSSNTIATGGVSGGVLFHVIKWIRKKWI